MAAKGAAKRVRRKRGPINWKGRRSRAGTKAKQLSFEARALATDWGGFNVQPTVWELDPCYFQKLYVTPPTFDSCVDNIAASRFKFMQCASTVFLPLIGNGIPSSVLLLWAWC
jgi:hypothetical protein